MELATIINRYQDRFNNHYSDSITNRQHHALESIAACHTERYGEMRLQCFDCNSQLLSVINKDILITIILITEIRTTLLLFFCFLLL